MSKDMVPFIRYGESFTRFTFTRPCIHHLLFLHYFGIEVLPFRWFVFPSVENIQLPKTSNVTPTTCTSTWKLWSCMMDVIHQRTKTSLNFVNGESFPRFIFFVTFFWYMYVYATLQYFFLDQIRSFYSFSTFFISYCTSHMTKMAIKLWVAQSLPLVCKRSYYFSWIFNRLCASSEFH